MARRMPMPMRGRVCVWVHIRGEAKIRRDISRGCWFGEMEIGYVGCNLAWVGLSCFAAVVRE